MNDCGQMRPIRFTLGSKVRAALAAADLAIVCVARSLTRVDIGGSDESALLLVGVPALDVSL